MLTGSFGDIWTWILDNDIYDKEFLFGWRNRDDKNKFYGKFRQFISVPSGGEKDDILVGFVTIGDDGTESEEVYYYWLADLVFAYVPLGLDLDED